MNVIQQVLDVVAPTSALKRRVAKDEWVRNMVICMRWKLFDSEKAKEDELSRMVQQAFDHAVREEMAEYLLRNVMRVADSRNRLFACRKWIVEEARAYAPVKVLFTTQSGYDLEVATGLRHPCNKGLWESKTTVIETIFKRELREHGSVDAVVDKLRKESLWRNTRANFANLGRVALADDVPVGKKDWFSTYINYLLAGAELEICASLGWAASCAPGPLKKEIENIEQRLLEGNPDPLEFVTTSLDDEA